MGKIIYITGGVRSGKSEFGEKIAESLGKEKIYLATSIIFDEEMSERVKQHQERRGKDWITIEGYKDLKEKLKNYSNSNRIVLLDCLTNYITNNLLIEREIDWEVVSPSYIKEVENELREELIEFFEFIKNSKLELIVISNEVGMGIVPPYPLGRYFRDISGRMNQVVAKYASDVYLVVSGIEMKIK